MQVSPQHGPQKIIAVAPMMDWTDRHYRVFARQLTRHTLLYTEMVTTGALLHGDVERHLGHDAVEHPLALQLGGSDPDALGRCAALATDWGFSEINLNVGCPSDRVQSGRFGACLMAEPDLVADCVKAMAAETPLPITVKHRIGIDDQEDWAFLERFVATVAPAGCATFIVHARKAILSGLSPKENRTIPPLMYDRAYALKSAFPHLRIILNGGVTSMNDTASHLRNGLDGVMLGRAAYETPGVLAGADTLLDTLDHTLPGRDLGATSPAEPPIPSASLQDSIAVVQALMTYAESLAEQDQPAKRLTRHMMGLFHGQPGARLWRRRLGETASNNMKGAGALEYALSAVNTAG